MINLRIGAGSADAIAKHEADAVVLDLHLPDVPGEQVFKEIRGLSPVPILVVSGDESRCQGLVRSREEHVNYLIKPFSPNALVAKVQEIVEASAG